MTILQDRGAEWVVNGGMQDGDRVIVAGFQKTGVGAAVAPEEREAPQARRPTTQTKTPPRRTTRNPHKDSLPWRAFSLIARFLPGLSRS